jgi:hypothetical protein
MRRHVRPLLSIAIVLLFTLFLTLSAVPLPLGSGTALADPGSGWEEQDLPLTEGEITGISAASGETAWAAINITSFPDMSVLKTENGGDDWSIQNLGTAVYGGSTPDIYAVDENIAWTYKWGAVYKTVDGGNTWSEAGRYGVPSVHGGTWPQDIYAQDENLAWFLAWNYNMFDPVHPSFFWSIYRTSDSGSDWNEYVFTYPVIPYYYQGVSSVDVGDDKTIWVSLCSNPAVVARSTDGGAGWQAHELSALYVYDIHAFDADSAWAIGNATTSQCGRHPQDG